MNRNQKKIAKKEAGRIIIDGINDFLDQSKSPVSGGSFKTKKVDGDRSILFEEGDMRDAIKSTSRVDDIVEVGIWKASEKKKAYNHNMGENNSSDSTMPERRFIPDEDQPFKKSIMTRVNRRMNEIRKGATESKFKRSNSTTLDALFNEATSSISGDESSSDASLSFTIGELLELFDGD